MIKGLFVGLSTIDVIYSVHGFPAPNTKAVAERQRVCVGGPATNAAISFSHLDGHAILATVVGQHPLADLIRAEMDHFSIQHVDLNRASRDLPPISSIVVSPNGDRSIVSGRTHYVPPSMEYRVDEELLQQAAILLVDGHEMDYCIAWAHAARIFGIPVVLDGGSWKDGTQTLLSEVDVAICSVDFRPPGHESPDAIIEYLRGAGVRQIAITRGADPVVFANDKAKGELPVRAIAAVDTAAAGDVFHGAFCYQYATYREFTVALAFAAEVATIACERGPRDWMRYGTPVSVPVGVRKSASPGQTTSSPRTPSASAPTVVAASDKPSTSIFRDIDRREFFALGGLVGALIAGTNLFVTQLQRRQDKQAQALMQKLAKEEEEMRVLLKRYFWPVTRADANVLTLPALSDPFTPKGVERRYSSSGSEVSFSFLGKFLGERAYAVNNDIQVGPDDCPVAISSEIVNAFSRRYFGDPMGKTTPNHWVRFHDDYGGYYEAELRWALFNTEGPDAHFRQPFEDKGIFDRFEPVKQISDLETSRRLASNLGKSTWGTDIPRTDYLLVTVVPRDHRCDRRFMSLAGVYRPGTLGAANFFDDPSLDVLRKIHGGAQGHEYFQALIEFEIDNSNLEHARPAKIISVHACPLKNIRAVPPVRLSGKA